MATRTDTRRKFCPACTRRRRRKFFYVKRDAKDGRQRLCIDCDNGDRRKRYTNPVTRDTPWRPRLRRKVCSVCCDLGRERPPEGCRGCGRPPTVDG